MGEQGGFAAPTPSGGMDEHLNALVHPPATGPASIKDLSSILLGSTQHFQLDLDQAPKAIAAFRQAAEGLRDLMDEARQLMEISPPAVDAVSIHAAKEFGQWAASLEPGSLRAALQSGAIQLEETAEALERSLTSCKDIDDGNAAHLRRSEL